MKWRVLISAPYMQPEVKRFSRFFTEHGIETVVPPVEERLEEDELFGWLGDIDGVISGDDHFTERVLKRADGRLKVISKWGTGVDSIDLQAAERLWIRVCNTPNAFTDPVADTVLGYILAFARQLPWMDRQMRQGHWEKAFGVSLAERALGVIGVGRIGQAVVRRAVSFRMRVLGNDVHDIPPKFVAETGLELRSKGALLEQADFVSLNCDLNVTSYRIIGTDEFRTMKKTAVLVNTARGGLVDELALVSALQDGRIGGAALDVFEKEPLPKDSPLRALDNVMMAPHNANSSRRAWEHVHVDSLRNLVRGLEASAPVEARQVGDR